MNGKDILDGGKLRLETSEEVVEQSAPADDRPAVSDEEYIELRNLQGQQTVLQAQGYQAYNFLKQLKQQFEEIQNNYNNQKAEADASLERIEADLKAATETFQVRFREITSAYGFEGIESVNIEEASPHYISLPTPAPAVEG